MSHTPNWQDSKEAQAHFATVYALLEANPNAEFPYSIEAELEALADGDCIVSAWDAFCEAQALDKGLQS